MIMNLGKFCFNSLDIRSLHYTLDIYVSLMKVNYVMNYQFYYQIMNSIFFKLIFLEHILLC